jgi:hypothetical protein
MERKPATASDPRRPDVPTAVRRSPLIKDAKQGCQIDYKGDNGKQFYEVFQLVFQSKYKIKINDNNQ